MPGWQLDENNNPVWVGTDVTNPTDTNLTSKDVSSTTATNGMTDLGEGYLQDANGNIYTSDGTLYATVNSNGDYTLAGGDSSNTWTDPDTGQVWTMGSDGNWSAEGGDTTVANNTYVDPDTGQVWTLGADGTWSAEGGDTTTASNTWTDPDTGEVWNMGSDGSWTSASSGSDGSSDTYDTSGSDGSNVSYNPYVKKYAYNTNNSIDLTGGSSGGDTSGGDTSGGDNGGGDPMGKKGGLIHFKDGVPRFADAGSVDSTGYSDTTEEVQPWQNVDYNYTEDTNGPITGSQSLYSQSGPYKPTYLKSTAPAITADTSGGSDNSGFTPTPGIQYFADGSYIQTFDDGSTITVDANGNVAGTTDGYQTTVDDQGNTTVTDGYGNVTVYDPNGNVIPVGGGRETVGPITSTGSGRQQSYAAANAAKNPDQNTPDQSGIIDQLKNYITQNPGLAGGAIGALLSSLMSQAGDSNSAGPSQPVDISALTAINPRTTDFGPGMTGGRTGTGSSIVNYNDYAENYGDYTPDQNLYSDLGVSGYLNEPDMTTYTDDQGNLVDQYGNPIDLYGNPVDFSAPAPSDTNIAADTAGETTEEPAMAAGGPTTHYTFGRVIDPAENLGLAQGMKRGGLSQAAHTMHSHQTNPVVDNRVDFRKGSAVNGAGDGQSDDIPAWLADGEYVMDAELVSMLGNGSNKAGAKILDKFREEVRSHKRSAPLGKIPPKAKSPLNYLKEAMNG
jgi:hypothetical protein